MVPRCLRLLSVLSFPLSDSLHKLNTLTKPTESQSTKWRTEQLFKASVRAPRHGHVHKKELGLKSRNSLSLPSRFFFGLVSSFGNSPQPYLTLNILPQTKIKTKPLVRSFAAHLSPRLPRFIMSSPLHITRPAVLLIAAFLLALSSSFSFVDATPPSDVYVYSLMTWTENSKVDSTIAYYMSAHKDSPMWAIEFLNNSTDILPNTTIHYVVEDHGSDPIYAARLLNKFLDSAIYPVALILVESVDHDVNRVIAKFGNVLNIPVATVIGPGSEYTDQTLYSNVLRGVSS